MVLLRGGLQGLIRKAYPFFLFPRGPRLPGSLMTLPHNEQIAASRVYQFDPARPTHTLGYQVLYKFGNQARRTFFGGRLSLMVDPFKRFGPWTTALYPPTPTWWVTAKFKHVVCLPSPLPTLAAHISPSFRSRRSGGDTRPISPTVTASLHNIVVPLASCKTGSGGVALGEQVG